MNRLSRVPFLGGKACNRSNVSYLSRNFTAVVKDKSPRPEFRTKDVLEAWGTPTVYTIRDTATIQEAVAHLIKEKAGCSLVTNSENDVCGIFTSRDIIKFIGEASSLSGAFSNYHTNKGGKPITLTAKISEIMVPKERLVFCSSSDSRRRCREVMYVSKVRNLPVIDNGEVKGIMTANMIADSMFSLNEVGGKKGFISNVSHRKGLPEGTKYNSTETVDLSMAPETPKLDLSMAAYALPNPFKKPNPDDAEKGVAMNRRNYGAGDLCNDLALSEDAHFCVKLGESSGGSIGSSSAGLENDGISYMCVADGVGSWRQYGVNPQEYSHKLVENARKIIEMDVEHRKLMQDSPFGEYFNGPIHPLDVLVDAWNATSNESDIAGSSTFCIAMLDKTLNQISYSNIGDGGLMVVRHIDSETAGYMRDRSLPRHMRTNDLKIAYLSQQQLRSFNLPYQLGSNGTQTLFKGSFESPGDADTASIPVLPGDIILLATDGLFDNLDLAEIIEEMSLWERDTKPSEQAEAGALQELAKRLVQKARLFSLDKNRDSPFAILAKENDIMWGGGMPDDTSVVVAKVCQQ